MAAGSAESRQRFEVALTVTLTTIDRFIAANDAAMPTHPLAQDQTAECLRQLAALLAAHKVTPHALMAELRTYLTGHIPDAMLAALLNQIDRFDYATAQATLRDIAITLDI